jgi:hypothetical protein
MPDFGDLQNPIFTVGEYNGVAEPNLHQLRQLLNSNGTVGPALCIGISMRPPDMQLHFSRALEQPAETDVLTTLLAGYTYQTPATPVLDEMNGDRDPSTADDSAAGYTLQSRWRNRISGQMWVCASDTPGQARWQPSSVRYQKTTVSTVPGEADYTSISAAFAAGNSSVFVRDGIYYETQDIVIPNGGTLIGETLGNVKLIFVTGKQIRCDALAAAGMSAAITAGTISCIGGTNQVTGQNTQFSTGGIQPGYYIQLVGDYYPVLSVQDDTHLTLAETFIGNSVVNHPYQAHPMYLGVQIKQLIVVGSQSAGLDLRGLRNSTVHGVACKSNAISIRIRNSSVVAVQSGAALSSAGDSIVVEQCSTVHVNSMAIMGSAAGSGVHCINSRDTVISGCACNVNGQNGIRMSAGASYMNVNNTVMRNNTQKGLGGDVQATDIGVVNCDVCNNGDAGIDLLGTNNSIGHCSVLMNASHGINIGDNSIVCSNNVDDNGGDGINLVTSNYSIVMGNAVDDNVGCGIRIQGQYNTVSHNNVQSNLEMGICVEVGSLGTSMLSNMLRDNQLQDGGTLTRNSGVVMVSATDPDQDDDITKNVSVGDLRVNTGTVPIRMWMCVRNTANTALWMQLQHQPHLGPLAAVMRPRLYQSLPSTVITAGTDQLLTGTQLLESGGMLKVQPTGASINLQMPAAADLLAAMPEGVGVGDCLTLMVVHSSASTESVALTTNTGITLFGNMVVLASSPSASAQFHLIVTSTTSSAEAVEVVRIA